MSSKVSWQDVRSLQEEAGGLIPLLFMLHLSCFIEKNTYHFGSKCSA